VLPEPLEVEAAQVVAIEVHRPALGVIEALNKRDDCALATPRRPNKRNTLPNWNSERERVQNNLLRPRRVTERHVAQLDLSAHLLGLQAGLRLYVD